jgi:hypothetical protein
MTEFVPHPLVTRVGMYLSGDKGPVTFPDRAAGAASDLVSAKTEADAKAPDAAGGDSEGASSPVTDPIDDDRQFVAEKNALAAALANQANLPDLTLVAGYLGGQVDHSGEYWRLLYLDSRLHNWLLILEDDIVVHQRLDDDHAASGKRDALWVNGTTTMVCGSGARASEGRFLVGDFTKAGDYAASTSGGTFSAATGLLCEATTPGCCWGTRTR